MTTKLEEHMQKNTTNMDIMPCLILVQVWVDYASPITIMIMITITVLIEKATLITITITR